MSTEQKKENMREYARLCSLAFPDRVAASSRRRKERYNSDPEFRKRYLLYFKTKRIENPELIRAQDREKYCRKKLNPLYRKKHSQYNKEYIQSLGPLERKNRRDKYLLKNPNVRIVKSLRQRILYAIKIAGSNKIENTMNLIGCSIEQLKEWLEAQFEKGMSWDNRGLYGWHIDHIRPCSAFDLSDPRQQRECFHFSNLQPLWSKENISKGNRIYPNLEELQKAA